MHPNLTPLSNGQPGIRSSLTIETRSPGPEELAGSPDRRVHAAASAAGATHADVLDFIASDESLDRYGEVICASGWLLDTYRRNPVFQNAHQYGDIVFTLGRALVTEVRPGTSSIPHSASAPPPSASVTPHSALRTPHSPLATPHSALRTPHLFQRVQFATDINPMARIAYGLYRGKFLNAVSVGFIPVRWEDGQSEPVRRCYLQQELLEVSAVAIPANPNALALALKSGAVEKSDVRETLELLRSVCGAGPASPPRTNADSPDQLLSFARELRRILRRA